MFVTVVKTGQIQTLFRVQSVKYKNSGIYEFCWHVSITGIKLTQTHLQSRMHDGNKSIQHIHFLDRVYNIITKLNLRNTSKLKH